MIFLILLTLLFTGCDNAVLPNIINSLFSNDRVLPSLTRQESLSMDEILLEFSKPIEVEEISIDGTDAPYIYRNETTVVVTSPQKLSIAEECKLFIRVRDSSFNSTAFSLRLRGKNDRIPTFVLNEFSSKGTSTQPDRIELEIHSSGNLEGICLMDGTKGNENFSYSLPSIEVQKGDYVVIYWDHEVDDEIVENSDGSQTVILFADSSTSLATNNGAFVIYDTVSGDGNVLDALVYTNGESTTYSGFGSKSVEASYNELCASFEWIGEAFNSKYSTSTRTVSRWIGKKDTNTAADFYITVTKGETFGRMNSSAEYEVT